MDTPSWEEDLKWLISQGPRTLGWLYGGLAIVLVSLLACLELLIVRCARGVCGPFTQYLQMLIPVLPTLLALRGFWLEVRGFRQDLSENENMKKG